MAQYSYQKIIRVDYRAQKELQSLPKTVQLKFITIFGLLERNGQLREPFGKKLSGAPRLFEMRVKCQGEWRSVYAYSEKEYIIVLSFFNKKTNQTPKAELFKAIHRFRTYEGKP
jgi:phage-related protein